MLVGAVVVLLVINLFGGRILEMPAISPDLSPADKMLAAGAYLLTIKFWIPLLAPLILISALWSAAAVFEKLRRGAPFNDTVVVGLEQIGSAMIWAGLAGCVLAPFLTTLDAGGRLPDVSLNTYEVAVGLIGVALRLIAGQARRMKAELEQFV